jgi:hypothetical protein
VADENNYNRERGRGMISECGSGEEGKEDRCEGECSKCLKPNLSPEARQQLLEIVLMKLIMEVGEKLPFEFTFEEMMLALKHIMEMSLETMQMLPGGPDTIFNKPE